jgi:hypothetical protein
MEISVRGSFLGLPTQRAIQEARASGEGAEDDGVVTEGLPGAKWSTRGGGREGEKAFVAGGEKNFCCTGNPRW